jgi:hypothetical protein
MLDFEALESASKRMAADPDGEMSVLALKGDAVRILQDVLLNADSDDVKRKAAVDVLNFSKASNTSKPTVSEEQLEYLGRVIVETEAVRLSVSGS